MQLGKLLNPESVPDIDVTLRAYLGDGLGSHSLMSLGVWPAHGRIKVYIVTHLLTAKLGRGANTGRSLKCRGYGSEFACLRTSRPNIDLIIVISLYDWGAQRTPEFPKPLSLRIPLI